jgi:CheY-like chemotaxis protein
MTTPNQEFDSIFAPERSTTMQPANTPEQSWKVLLVDDEPEIHEVTKFALIDFQFENRTLNFLLAHSAREAMELLQQHDDIAVAMIDVVMEHEHAGLELVKYIREQQQNNLIRLILRTGQPGQAPERKVIREYDINDYKEKTELSSQKLYTCVYTALRSYRDLYALDMNRKGLERVIRSSAEIFRVSALKDFIQGVLEQLVAILYLEKDAIYLNSDSLALQNTQGNMTILAATGR